MASRTIKEKRAMVLVRDKTEALKLVYGWVKQEAISLAEFRELIALIKEESNAE
jgi:hypothetical protein